MSRYAILNGDRIVGVVNWDGKGKHPYGDVTLRKLPDGAGANWVGKSYDDAMRAVKAAEGDSPAIDPPDGVKDGQRADELKAAEGGLHHSGEVFNSPDTATIAAEHPLDPVLGSEMRTPNLNVAIVPNSQPKTDEQAAKDAGDPVDRANRLVAEQEAAASDIRPPTSFPATDDDLNRDAVT